MNSRTREALAREVGLTRSGVAEAREQGSRGAAEAAWLREKADALEARTAALAAELAGAQREKEEAVAEAQQKLKASLGSAESLAATNERLRAELAAARTEGERGELGLASQADAARERAEALEVKLRSAQGALEVARAGEEGALARLRGEAEGAAKLSRRVDALLDKVSGLEADNERLKVDAERRAQDGIVSGGGGAAAGAGDAVLQEELEELRGLLEEKDAEVDALSLQCHALLQESKKAQGMLAEAEARLKYAAELHSSAAEPPRKRASPAAAPRAAEPEAPEPAPAAPLEFKVCEDMEDGALASAGPSPAASALGDRKKRLKPLPAREAKGEDKENAGNAPAVVAAPAGKKVRKLFNAVVMPDDLTGDPFATI